MTSPRDFSDIILPLLRCSSGSVLTDVTHSAKLSIKSSSWPQIFFYLLERRQRREFVQRLQGYLREDIPQRWIVVVLPLGNVEKKTLTER